MLLTHNTSISQFFIRSTRRTSPLLFTLFSAFLPSQKARRTPEGQRPRKIRNTNLGRSGDSWGEEKRTHRYPQQRPLSVPLTCSFFFSTGVFMLRSLTPGSRYPLSLTLQRPRGVSSRARVPLATNHDSRSELRRIGGRRQKNLETTST